MGALAALRTARRCAKRGAHRENKFGQLFEWPGKWVSGGESLDFEGVFKWEIQEIWKDTSLEFNNLAIDFGYVFLRIERGKKKISKYVKQ